MSEITIEKKSGFFKNHADTVAIISVNIAIGAIIVSMWVSNTSRIDATNARLDGLYNTIIEIVKNK